MGSPPRMRGKVYRQLLQQAFLGITPAYAGKSAAHAVVEVPVRDHPRVCGEKHMEAWSEIYHEGSPPRMRGKGKRHRPCKTSPGITPAYAGKSLVIFTVVSFPQDHPRVCGEKMVSMIPHRRSRGSPPRMRGKVGDVGVALAVVGITPAYAGKRSLYAGMRTWKRDHPRVCGEKGKQLVK